MAAVQAIRVVTTDSSPTVEPNRISNIPGYRVANVEIDLTADAVNRVQAVRVTPGARGLDTQILRGLVCGMGQRCGVQSRSLDSAAPFTVRDDVTFAEMGGRPDGDYDMNVHVLTPGGWE